MSILHHLSLLNVHQAVLYNRETFAGFVISKVGHLDYLAGAKLDEPIDEWLHIKVIVNGTNIKVSKPKINHDGHSAIAFIHGKVGVRNFFSDTKYDNIFVRPLEQNNHNMLTILKDHQEDLSGKDSRSLEVDLRKKEQLRK